MIGPDSSLIEDEFHAAAKDICERRVVARATPRPKGIFTPPAPRVLTVRGIPKGLVDWYDKLGREKHCRACLRPDSVRPLTRHHLIPQRWWIRQGGDFVRYRNIAANIIPLCRFCHDQVEHDREARRMLRRALTQKEIALVVALRGMGWLERAYPR